MGWIVDLFTQPSTVQVLMLIAIVCALGLILGNIKIKGISLGVTFIFFAGIFVGELMDRLCVSTDWSMISLAQNFGLVLFVYSLGVQVGPGFFPSLKKGGIRLNLYGLLTIALTTVAMLLIYVLTSVNLTDSMGLLCGAATNTPMLGAAQQAFLDIHPEQIEEANDMAIPCAVAYPFGVIGVMVALMLINRFCKGSESADPDHAGDVKVMEFHVSNPAIYGKTIADVAHMTEKHMIISRVWRGGKVKIPASKTVLKKDDHLLCVLSKDDIESFRVIFGTQEATDWNRPDIDWNNVDGSGLVSRHVLVTRKELNGVKIGSLHLRNSFNINITRVNRAGIQLVAYQGLRLQLGDRLTIVGDSDAISKVAEILGNEQKELRTPNLVSIFIGLFFGILLGSLPAFIPGMSTPVKLGLAGGPIIVGILMGAFGPRLHLSTYTTRSANMMLRQMGIVIYLACLGLSAGAGFLEEVLSLQGLMWIGISLLIAFVPIVICGFLAYRFGKMDFAQIAGLLCAAMANPMALTYANSNSDEQEASESYATVYPLSMFVRVISAQLIIMLLA